MTWIAALAALVAAPSLAQADEHGRRGRGRGDAARSAAAAASARVRERISQSNERWSARSRAEDRPRLRSQDIAPKGLPQPEGSSLLPLHSRGRGHAFGRAEGADHPGFLGRSHGSAPSNDVSSRADVSSRGSSRADVSGGDAVARYRAAIAQARLRAAQGSGGNQGFLGHGRGPAQGTGPGVANGAQPGAQQGGQQGGLQAGQGGSLRSGRDGADWRSRYGDLAERLRARTAASPSGEAAAAVSGPTARRLRAGTPSPEAGSSDAASSHAGSSWRSRFGAGSVGSGGAGGGSDAGRGTLAERLRLRREGSAGDATTGATARSRVTARSGTREGFAADGTASRALHSGGTVTRRRDVRDHLSGGGFGDHHDGDHSYSSGATRHRHRRFSGHVHHHHDGGFFVSWWGSWHYSHYRNYWLGGLPAFGFGVCYYEPYYAPYFEPGVVVWEPAPVVVAEPYGPAPAYGQAYGPAYGPGGYDPAPGGAPVYDGVPRYEGGAPTARGPVLQGPAASRQGSPAPSAPSTAEDGVPGADENDAAKQAFETGFRSFSEQRYEQALGMFRLVTDLDPKNGEAWLGRAHAAFAIGEYRDAAESVGRAADLGAFPRGYRFDPRPVYKTPGAFDTAFQRLQAYARSNPQDADAHILLAWLHVGLGAKDQAQASLASLKALRPDDPTAAFLRVAMLPPEPPPTAEQGEGGVPVRPPAPGQSPPSATVPSPDLGDEVPEDGSEDAPLR